tara:strand:- start:62 stop:748 length:687 start_codon:yes stop_codon:yes gene_type:complete
MIEQGKAQTLSLPVFDGGGVRVTPSAGTFTLFDAGGLAVIGPDGVTNLGSNDFALAALDTTTLSLGDRWREEWALTISGEVEIFRREAALVLRTLYPVITDSDLERVHRGLVSYLPGSQSSWDDQREEAWDQLQARLIGKGNRPNLIISSWALRNVHLYWTLTLIADLLRVTATGRWGQLAEDWGKRTEGEWNALTFLYDSDEDGTPEEEAEAAVPTLYLTDVPGDWY